ncbi:MAG: hypothetical protein KGH64_06535, partial [Candidatus Micrarchaeota archaeon]|nr:hypothetical protein [Candidatus Micrarchaeota archaeon]
MSQKILHAAIALVMISAIAFAAQMSINSTTAVSANILTNHSATVTTSTNISGSASGSTSNSTSGHHTGSHNLSTTSTSVVGVSSGGANPTVTSANVHASIQALSSANAKLTSQAINSQYSHISCQVNFTVSFLNNIIAAAPNESSTLNPLITALQQDSLQLHSYEASNNSTAFHAYISSTYNPEFKTANSGAKSALKSITNQTTRKALRTQYN